MSSQGWKIADGFPPGWTILFRNAIAEAGENGKSLALPAGGFAAVESSTPHPRKSEVVVLVCWLELAGERGELICWLRKSQCGRGFKSPFSLCPE
jgi:hypothetical protein